MVMTSNNNVLLVKTDVGKSKPTTYALPNNNYAYGKPYQMDKEGAKEVSMTWNFHQLTKDPAPKTDFKKLNKKFVKEGLSKPKDCNHYKKNHNIVESKKVMGKKNEKQIIDENMVFGNKVRPSTPIGKILANEYGTQSENILVEQYKKQEEDKIKQKPLEVKQNKSQMLTTIKNKQKIDEKCHENEKKKVFTLKKFQNVNPKTNTNNNQKIINQKKEKNSEVQAVQNFFENKNE